ncbi:long-chain acyl-CoA synthetase [Pseudonocardia sediminis]|uniref:Long-chain acyl-CoA synthetase n=1 Tax=Pseudonocardia sediminis TaxID=1397368 RepID=A0A4V6ME87_PSEST|nr:AMP-binding protein [Pseudonocardia sediminis]RZT83360.1 long-chain acyl-CoA synthetase [Pseudonocardia sediminis]
MTARPPVLSRSPVLQSADLPSDLLARAHGAAAVLRERGVRAGDRVAVDARIPPGADRADAGAGGRPGAAQRPGAADPWATLAWFLGADLLGAATLVVDPAWTPRERDAVLADAAPAVVAGGVPEPGPDVDPVGGDDSLFYLPTTSGSSGRPKVLARTRDSWRLGFDALGPVAGPVLIAGPLSSSLFLFGALHALHHGVELRFRSRLDAADARHAGGLHLVPAMLSGLLDGLERNPGPVALQTIVCGGAHVGPALRSRCAQLLPDSALVEYYGSAEHSLIASRRDDGPLTAFPGVDTEVRDDVLWVRSPQSFSGYLRDGVLDPAGTGWSSVGDRAEIDAGGGITVHGRGSATISSGGALVAAEEVETVLRAVPGVADVVVAGTPHPALGALVTAVIEAGDVSPSSRALREAARAGLAPGKHPRRWLVTSALPRTSSGKPARAVVDAGLRDGTLGATPLPSEVPR